MVLYDGKHVAAGGFDGTLTLWDWAGRRRLMARKHHRGGIHAVSFSRDADRISGPNRASALPESRNACTASERWVPAMVSK